MRRTFTGIATTGSVDRMGDVVEPRGGQWELPIPLLRSHDHDRPIGKIIELTATDEGIRVVCEVAKGTGAADQTWAEIKQGAMPSLSIGFRGLESEPRQGGGLRWKQWELLELSVVSVPANGDARIQRVSGAKGMRVANDTPNIIDVIPEWEQKGREELALELFRLGITKTPGTVPQAISAIRCALYCGLGQLDARLRKLEEGEA